MKHARQDYDRIQDPADKIPDDEPVFLLRGQDRLAPSAVRAYAKAAEDRGRIDIANASYVQADRMEAWQTTHGGGKLPDL